MKLLIAPFAKKLKVKKKNAKDFPWWPEVIDILRKEKTSKLEIIQVGATGDELLRNIDGTLFNKDFVELCKEIRECDVWASVDTFFHHVATYVEKPGVVVWSQSDPKHFGDPMHTNLYKDRKYFRLQQFQYWDMTNYEEEAFVSPDVVAGAILKLS